MTKNKSRIISVGQVSRRSRWDAFSGVMKQTYLILSATGPKLFFPCLARLESIALPHTLHLTFDQLKMAKRKIQSSHNGEAPSEPQPNKKQRAVEPAKPNGAKPTSSETIQVVVGFYDGVLHGLTATIGSKGKNKKEDVEFADTFLLTAHTKSIRCVAASPPSKPVPGQSQKVLLASGSADSKINLYDLSAHPPKKQDQDPLRHIAPRPIMENRKNKELGNLEHHTSAVTALRFPTRSKLLSASEDSTIAVTRTRDWSMLSSIHAPVAKPEGRPSGDTATFDGTPQGVNDFAVHPSMKLMLSVSKGERTMRLWNLMTGKKAGALNFERELLSQVGEGRHSSGEGKRVAWGNVDGEDEFAIGFDRDVVVFGMDSKPKCKIMPTTRTKIHHFDYISLDEESGPTLLAVSTEDGRIVFASTEEAHITKIKDAKNNMAPNTARVVAQLGGKDGGVTGRIKGFVVVRSAADTRTLYVVGGNSDGTIRLWAVEVDDLKTACAKPRGEKPIGRLIGTYSTDNRLTCMAAFMMIPHPDGEEESDEEDLEEDEEEASSASEDEESD